MKNRYIHIFSFLIALLLFVNFPACELDYEVNFVKGITISVTTNPISNIGSTYAVVGGVVKATSNNTVITERGVVYSTSPNPTIESDNNVSGGSGLGSFGCNLVDLLDETKYYVRAYAINGYGKVLYGEEKSFTTNRATYENGHEYIDLGLSVKWATMNVGATRPDEYGDHFAWGETEPKATYDWSTYKWCNGSETTLTKYNTDISYGSVDNKTQLDLSDDAARANWGGAWRMPTDVELSELRDQCTWTWMTQNGVKGYEVKSKNGNFIFLPAAGHRYDSWHHNSGPDGYYWSSSLHTDFPNYAWSVHLESFSRLSSIKRYFGLSVRPVLGENESVQKTAPTVTTAVVTQITETSAVAGGNVTSDGNAGVTERGVVYSTNPNPVITNLNNTIHPCGSGTGEFTYTITGLQSGTTYYVRAYAKNDVGTAYGEEMSFTTKVQATPEYVDLGLSVKWATFNVGASTPEEYGDYFAWGETEPKLKEPYYWWNTYKWCNGSETTLTKYNIDRSCGIVDYKTQLDFNDDAARVNWGGVWRMPTDAEWTELREQCTWRWTTQNGVNGYKVTSKKLNYSANSIFLPAAGHREVTTLYEAGNGGDYWSSWLYTNYTYRACGVYFDSSIVGSCYDRRYYGKSIRPVFGDNDVETMVPTVTTVTVTQITETTAVAGGNVTNAGNASVIDRGVVYSTNPNPVFTDLNNTIRPCGSGTGKFTCTLTGLQAGTTYYVRAYAINSKGIAYGSQVSFITKEQSNTNNGTENGYAYVDLGLSVKWATMNVGASSPEDYGDYFAWGETTTKTIYNWSTYTYCNGSETTLMKYNTSNSFGIVDNETTLSAIDDAATVNWGGAWRMPTNAELTELLNNCTWTWIIQNGVKGYNVTSKSNGNSIFLPAAGYRYDSSLISAGSNGNYRSSSLYTELPSSAWCVYFHSTDVYGWIGSPRHYGEPVRPVCQ